MNDDTESKNTNLVDFNGTRSELLTGQEEFETGTDRNNKYSIANNKFRLFNICTA